MLLAAAIAFLFFVCFVSTKSVLVITDSWYVGFEVGTCTTDAGTGALVGLVVMVDTEATACATELMTPTGSTGLLALGDAAGGVTFGGTAGVELPDALG